MVTHFRYDSVNASLRERSEKKSQITEIILEDYKQFKGVNNLFGMKFYPETFNFCMDKFEKVIKNVEQNPIDSGSWMVFLPLEVKNMLEPVLVELIREHNPRKRLIGFKLIPVRQQSKFLSCLQLRPFYDIEYLSYILEIYKELTSSLAFSNGTSHLTYFYKPDILDVSKSLRSNTMRNYILKRNYSC